VINEHNYTFSQRASWEVSGAKELNYDRHLNS